MPHTTVNAYTENLINQTQEAIVSFYQIAGVIFLLVFGTSFLIGGLFSALQAKWAEGNPIYPINPYTSRRTICFVLGVSFLAIAGCLMLYWWV